jgi:hypothetical protein
MVECLSKFTANNAQDLVEYSQSSPHDYSAMIQAFNRFLIERVVNEWTPGILMPRLLESLDENTSVPSPITQLFGLHAKSVNTCTECRTRRSKDALTHVVDLIYPRAVSRRFHKTFLRFSRVNERTRLYYLGWCFRFHYSAP